jgi:hypothetical protein
MSVRPGCVVGLSRYICKISFVGCDVGLSRYICKISFVDCDVGLSTYNPTTQPGLADISRQSNNTARSYRHI